DEARCAKRGAHAFDQEREGFCEIDQASVLASGGFRPAELIEVETREADPLSCDGEIADEVLQPPLAARVDKPEEVVSELPRRAVRVIQAVLAPLGPVLSSGGVDGGVSNRGRADRLQRSRERPDDPVRDTPPEGIVELLLRWQKLSVPVHPVVEHERVQVQATSVVRHACDVAAWRE